MFFIISPFDPLRLEANNLNSAQTSRQDEII